MQIKKVEDYFEALYKKYPDVPKNDIKRIIRQGWKNFYMLNSMGGDVLVKKNDGFWLYCGQLCKDSIRWFQQYVIKLSVKFRRNFIKARKKWDGYYYFALNDKDYEKYQKQIKSTGRPRKYFHFDFVMLYKLEDECRLKNSNKKYFFRTFVGVQFGWLLPKTDCDLDNIEVVEIKEKSLKFKDILVSNNNYNFYG